MGTRPGKLSSSILIASFPFAWGNRLKGKASSPKRNFLWALLELLPATCLPPEPASAALPAKGPSSNDLELK